MISWNYKDTVRHSLAFLVTFVFVGHYFIVLERSYLVSIYT